MVVNYSFLDPVLGSSFPTRASASVAPSCEKEETHEH